MVFSIGSRVRLVHTGDVGKVTAWLHDGMVRVLLDDGFEIPVAEEFLVAPDTPKSKKVSPHSKNNSDVHYNTSPQSAMPPPATQGLQLAFVPIAHSDGTTAAFDIYILNTDEQAVLFSMEITFWNYKPISKEAQLQGLAYLKIGQIPFDYLNDGPIVDIEWWLVLPNGTGKKQFMELKIKPKSFFTKMTDLSLFDLPVHLYILSNQSQPKKKSTIEDLKTYTQRHATPFKKRKKQSFANTASVEEFAHFNTEIDLHIEALAPSNKKRSNADIVRIQLQAFDDYIAKAIRLGVERVFIIHGLGEGKLRNHIMERLIQNPYVDHFRNDYHPKYGYGATEVLF